MKQMQDETNGDFALIAGAGPHILDEVIFRINIRNQSTSRFPLLNQSD